MDASRSTRVRVFIDYQNVYHRARGAFGLEREHPAIGNVLPLRLAALLNLLGKSKDPHRELESAWVYRGEPTSRSHPHVQAAFQRQVGVWRQSGGPITVVTRPLRYLATEWDHHGRPIAWGPGEEKGIDVLVALGMVLGAVRDEYDVAVLVSGDTDLVPAIDEVRRCGKRVENAVWKPTDGPARGLRPSNGGGIWCHRLDATHFTSVRDDTDYVTERSDPSLV